MLAGSFCYLEAKRENVCSVMLTGLSCSKGLRGRVKRERMFSFMSAGLTLLLAKDEAKRAVEKWLAWPFYVALGR